MKFCHVVQLNYLHRDNKHSVDCKTGTLDTTLHSLTLAERRPSLFYQRLTYSSMHEISALLSCSNKQPHVWKARNISCFIWSLNTGLTVYSSLKNIYKHDLPGWDWIFLYKKSTYHFVRFVAMRLICGFSFKPFFFIIKEIQILQKYFCIIQSLTPNRRLIFQINVFSIDW